MLPQDVDDDYDKDEEDYRQPRIVTHPIQNVFHKPSIRHQLRLRRHDAYMHGDRTAAEKAKDEKHYRDERVFAHPVKHIIQQLW
jgi:hypothetical protein